MKHLGAFVAFVLVAAAWSFPLAAHLTTRLPGPAVGDNALFFWNFWWMRTALAQGRDFFTTPYLFAPIGADLTLHTHSALPAFVGATALSRLSVLTALNVTTLVSLSLNGFCAYLLAWRETHRWGASMVGGAIFTTSPYLAAHLNGHFNLIAAWPLPLFALFVGAALESSVVSAFRRTVVAVGAGFVLALTAYIDYYYVVFALAMAACLIAADAVDWSVRSTARRRASAWLVVVLIAAALDLAAIIVVRRTGGFAGRAFGIRISMTDTYNPLQIFWLLVAVCALLWWRPRVTVRRREQWSWFRSLSALGVLAAVFAIGAGPLLWKGLTLMARGQYVSQQYYWRSAPAGVDAATLVLGNPFHGVWGTAIQALYARVGAGINAVEQSSWLGVVPLVLACYALGDRRDNVAVRRWWAVASVFMIWALGPHLRIAGHDTGMILPQAFLRYVPIVSNARVPGRAVVVVMLAVSMLAAAGAARATARIRRPGLAMAAIASLIALDFAPMPFPLTPADCPSVYETLRDRPEQGAVAELPISMGDGLGEIAPVDNRMLLCQAVHRRPLVGGFIARISPNVTAFYESDPLLAAWIRLSGGFSGVKAVSLDRAAAGQRLHADGIAFIVLNRERASAALRAQVNTLPLEVVAEDEHQTVYVVRP